MMATDTENVGRLRMGYEMTMYRIRLFIRWRKQSAWMFLARIMPREARKWVLIQATCKVWERGGITPDQINYEMIYKAIEPRPGH